MTMSRKLKIGLLTAVLGFLSLNAMDTFTRTGSVSVTSTAEARVGRPLTPVSVAGVARRTVRRCAVGVYNC
jgi:hypothetical protein